MKDKLGNYLPDTEKTTVCCTCERLVHENYCLQLYTVQSLYLETHFAVIYLGNNCFNAVY